MNIEAIRAASARVTSPGQPYEVVPQTVHGVVFRVFKNAPANLRGLYRSSLVHAHKDFYVYQDERYSSDEAWRQAARVAHRLLSTGIKQGDRVGIAARNYPEWLFAFMGITSIGAVAVTMNAWWSSEELAYGIDDSGLELLFADAERPNGSTSCASRHCV
jgi:long-chain acyl-CoA synthetase